MIDFSLDGSGTGGTLLLSGALTIQQALPLKEALVRASSEADPLTIDLEQVENMDLTALQLLCAAHRDWRRRGKKTTCKGTIPEAVHRIVRESGFSGCAGDEDDIGLWTGASN